MGDDKNEGLIARPGQCLYDHLANCSSLAAAFSASLGLPTAGELIGYLHDAGKASSACPRGSDHGIVLVSLRYPAKNNRLEALEHLFPAPKCSGGVD